MPVQRFRSFEEAEQALWVPSGDPSIGPRMRAVLALSRRLAPGVGRPGVRKYRSVEEAQAEREQWEQERVDALRAQRGLSPRSE